METCFVMDYGHFSVKHGTSRASSRRPGAACSLGAKQKSAVVTLSPSCGYGIACAAPSSAGCASLQHNPAAAASIHTPCDGLLRPHHQFTDIDAVAATVAKLYAASDIQPRSATCVFLTHPKVAPVQRELLTQILFEKIAVRRLHIGYSQVSSLFGCGCTNGVVVDAGHWTTSVVPISDGRPMRRFISETPVGGALQSELVKNVLLASDERLPDEALDANTLHSIKSMRAMVKSSSGAERAAEAEPTCDIGVDPDGSVARGTGKSVVLTLPDGSAVNVVPPMGLFEAAGETLFAPTTYNQWLGCSETHSRNNCRMSLPTMNSRRCVCAVGITDLTRFTLRSIAVSHPAVWKEVLLCGGPSSIPGTVERFKQELAALPLTPVIPTLPAEGAAAAAVRHRAVPDRITCSWVGASMFTQIASFNSFCCDAATYYEEGPARCIRHFGTDFL